MDSLYFEDGFRIRLNRDKDPVFLLIDYGSRSYDVNMGSQHFHDFYEIFIPLDEGAGHLVDGRYISLSKGDILFLGPQLLHMSIYPKKKESQRRIIINFRPGQPLPGLDYQFSKIEALFSEGNPVLRLPPSALSSIVSRLNDLFSAAKAMKSGWQIEIYSLFMLFLLEIARLARRNEYEKEERVESSDVKMYKITEYVKENYTSPLTLQGVSSAFAISPYYLSHQFSRIVGMPFISYVQRVRIRSALQMLSYTGARIHDVILACGFSSSSQFNRTFYSFCRVSPTEFRKMAAADRERLIDSIYPERKELVPSAFPPRPKVSQRRQGSREGMSIGITAEALGPLDPDTLKERLGLLGVDTVYLDIPRSMPLCIGYRTISERRLSVIRSLGLDISILGVTVTEEDMEEECRAAIAAASFLSSPVVGVSFSTSCLDSFLGIFPSIMPEASRSGIRIAIDPFSGCGDDRIQKVWQMINGLPALSILLDPAGFAAADERRNTFSIFEDLFSSLGSRIAALLLNDSIDGHSTALGKGIMARTYPHIASLVREGIPLIRSSAEPSFIMEDLMYIRRTFL